MTNKQMLKALPMAARMKAYKNTDNKFLNKKANTESVGRVLACCFVWSSTKEGYNYWKSIADSFGPW